MATTGTQLIRTSDAPPERLTGSALDWAFSFSAMGLITAAGATLPFFWMAVPLQGYHLVLAALATSTAFLVGGALPSALDYLRTRVRIGALVAYAVLSGGLWGGIVSGVAATLTNPHFMMHGFSDPLPATRLALAGAVVGALQVGWFWLAHAIQTAMGGKRWPLVLTAAAIAPLLGALGGLFLWL